MSDSSFSLDRKQRLVIKIGSSLLVDDHDTLKHTWLNSIADDIQTLRQMSKEVVLVSSGAIALGKKIVSFEGKRMRLSESQAAAAIGQIELGRVYREVLEQRRLTCAQILVTLEDTEQRRRYLNARSTIQSLLRLGVIPVVNENDTVATHEIRFGDNDRLSARVATMVSADLLIILSDVNGLYTSNPGQPDAEFVSLVENVTPEIERMAGGSISPVGTGGMTTKVQAAKIATQAGTEVVVASGLALNPISALINGAKHTLFKTHDNPISARKKWIASDLVDCGSVTIDDGAKAAIRSGKSLLPIGVVGFVGSFSRGDVIHILDVTGRLIGRGISNYDCDDTKQIMGHKADRIGEILGFDGPENIIHRDDMVLFDSHGH